MLEVLRGVFGAALSYIGAVLAATLGAFLYPSVTLFSFAGANLRVIFFILAIVIPSLAIEAGHYLNTEYAVGLIGSISAGLVVSGALVGLLIGALPLLFIRSTLRILINTPLQGLRAGWNEGFVALFVYAKNAIFLGERMLEDVVDQDIIDIPGVHFNQILQRLHEAMMCDARVADELQPLANPLVEVPVLTHRVVDLNEFFMTMLTAALIAGLQPEPDELNAIVLRLGTEMMNAARRPMTEGEFISCQLSQVEISALKSNRRARLTMDEIRRLELSDVTTELNAYKNLLRLDTDLCAISLDRPSREDAVLLVKQYKNRAEWVPVRGSAHIYDKEMLRGYFMVNAVHPTNGDLILAPSRHRMDGVEHETRYILHPYYVGAGPGVSQEGNALTKLLRNRLQRMPINEVHDEGGPIAFISRQY